MFCQQTQDSRDFAARNRNASSRTGTVVPLSSAERDEAAKRPRYTFIPGIRRMFFTPWLRIVFQNTVVLLAESPTRRQAML